jgi:hypothetical protein
MRNEWKSMKKAYVKPGLGVRTYAQFENVYTGCNKNEGWIQNGKKNCTYNAAWTPNYKPRPDHYCAWMDNNS